VGRKRGKCSLGASDGSEGRTFVGTRRNTSEGSTSSFAKGSQMGFSGCRRAHLTARNAITEREASLRGNALVATVSEEGAGSTKDVITKGAST